MTRTFALMWIGVLIAGVAPSTSWAADKSPEEVLRGKGLKQAGVFYILEQAEAQYDQKVQSAKLLQIEYDKLQQQLAVLNQSMELSQNNFDQLDQRRQTLLSQSFENTKDSGQRRSQEDDRNRQVDTIQNQMTNLQQQVLVARLTGKELAGKMAQVVEDFRRGQAGIEKLVAETAARYKALAGDSEVAEAIKEINKTANPKVALGPARDFKSYKLQLAQSAADVLGQKGLIHKDNRVHLAAESEVTRLVHASRQLQSEMTRAAYPPTATLPPRGVTPVATARKATSGTDSAAAKAAARLVAKREEFVQNVHTLRKWVDQIQAQFEALTIDDELRRAVADLARSTKKPAKNAPSLQKVHSPEYASSVKKLEEFEKAIRTESIPVVAKEGALWAEATLNGKPGRTMVVDPQFEGVTLPSRLAAEADVSPTSAASVTITTADGRTVAGHPAVLRSVQVGTFTAQNVECVIVPDGETNAPPRLGAPFLGHFVSKLSPDEKTLTLTEVTIPVPRPVVPARAKAGKTDVN